MRDISINQSNTERVISELMRKIQAEIIDAGRASGDAIIGAVEHSSGEFIEALKEEVTKEAAVMDSVGELLTAMAEYILSASNAFASVDAAYNTSKV